METVNEVSLQIFFQISEFWQSIYIWKSDDTLSTATQQHFILGDTNSDGIFASRIFAPSESQAIPREVEAFITVHKTFSFYLVVKK